MPRNLKMVRRTGRESGISGPVRREWLRGAGWCSGGEDFDRVMAEDAGVGQTGGGDSQEERFSAGRKKGESE